MTLVLAFFMVAESIALLALIAAMFVLHRRVTTLERASAKAPHA